MTFPDNDLRSPSLRASAPPRGRRSAMLPFGFRSPVSGFSLVELLVVIAIIAIMATITMSAVGEMSKRGKFNKALWAVVAEMELAQQAAVAGSTYTWVAFADQSNAPLMVSARSLEGASPASLPLDISATNSPAMQLGRVQKLENVVLRDVLPSGHSFAAARLPSGHPTTNTPMSSALVVKAKPPGALPTTDFAWAVEFNPMGEAKIRRGTNSAPPVDAIQMVVIPSAGASPSETENKQASLIWINGLSGGTRIYQP